MRRTPIWRERLSLGIASLPQQKRERWIGQSWFWWSLMVFSKFGFENSIDSNVI
jgi:hypothetical protein